MDPEPSLELAVLATAAMAASASFFGMLTRERGAGIGYIRKAAVAETGPQPLDLFGGSRSVLRRPWWARLS